MTISNRNDVPLFARSQTQDVIDQFRKEGVRYVEQRDSEVATLTTRYDATIEGAYAKASFMECFPEPKIGQGEMPYLIGVEFFIADGIREHGHISGRTRRERAEQVWRYYDSDGDCEYGEQSWTNMVQNCLMRSNKCVRLYMPDHYSEFTRAASLDGCEEFPDSPSRLRQPVAAVPEAPPVPELPKEVEGIASVKSRLNAYDVVTVKVDTSTGKATVIKV